MSHWVLMVAPLALASSVMLFAFVGCGLDSSGIGGPETYDGDVLSIQSLVAYWRLGEAPPATTAVDSKGDNDGTYVGGVTLGQPGALAASTDTAVLLDGVDGHITTAFNPFQPGVARTFEGWANRNSNKNDHALFAGDSAGSYPVLRCTAGSDDVRFNPDVSGAGQDFVGVLPGTGVWFHWALVWDGPSLTATLFIDGVNKGKLTFGFDFGGDPGNIELGAEGGASSPFDGLLDEVAVYDAALDDATIQSHFTVGTTTAG